MLEILSQDLSGAFAMVQQIADFLHSEVPAAAESRVHELLHVLKTTSHKSRQMIRDLVAVEFLQSSSIDLKCKNLKVSAIIMQVLKELHHHHLLSQHFLFELPTQPLYANLDVNKITQVLTNLLSNALKFTPDGGAVSVVVEPGQAGGRIVVRDTGIGIPAAMQSHLFEHFTQARRPGLRGGGPG